MLAAIPVGTQRYAGVASRVPLSFLCVDQSDIAYEATEMGISHPTIQGPGGAGTGLMAYGKADAGEFLLTKHADVTREFVVTVTVGALDLTNLALGSLALLPATEDRFGFVKKATQAQVTTGTDDEAYVTPAQLASRVSVGAVSVTGDLNGYTTEGAGYGDASTVTNEPDGTSGEFVLNTYKVGSGTNLYMHEYTDFATLATFKRTTSDGGTTWTAWRRTDADIRISTSRAGATVAPDGTIWLSR